MTEPRAVSPKSIRAAITAARHHGHRRDARLTSTRSTGHHSAHTVAAAKATKKAAAAATQLINEATGLSASQQLAAKGEPALQLVGARRAEEQKTLKERRSSIGHAPISRYIYRKIEAQRKQRAQRKRSQVVGTGVVRTTRDRTLWLRPKG